jgi:hypothetical protein
MEEQTDFVSAAVTAPGRALSIRVRREKYDITVHNIYAPTEEAPPAKKESFWQSLFRAKWRILHRTTNVLMGAANGHIGKRYNYPGIGKQGQESYNVNGHLFADLVSACDLAVVDTVSSEKRASAITRQGKRIDYSHASC